MAISISPEYSTDLFLWLILHLAPLLLKYEMKIKVIPFTWKETANLVNWLLLQGNFVGW